MKTTKEKIEIMQAYDRGEQIQIKGSNIDWIDIIDIVSPKWDWINYDYRVKPKPKYAPFSTAEQFLEAQEKHGQAVIQYVNKEKTVFNQFYAYVNNLGKIILYDRGDSIRLLTLKQLFFDDYYFDNDLTPCGKEMLE